ncbi:hypothetical protein [Paludisphaera rhizosphaerae]|uniref:hypothetical protein n=1 Tax=Paludisphaera rhizosphaerae TaxID=2711216 RepID=UPI0013EBD6A2|nr:hypothetical protein [Paludisphaera rhizosphaerae]
MNRSMLSTPLRRPALVLLIVGLVFGSGCEEPDETVRGAGSIDVPVQELGFQLSDAPAPTPPLEDYPQNPNLNLGDEAVSTGRN